MVDPRKLSELYHRGIITRTDVVIHAAKAAVELDPESFAAVLPKGCLEELRQAAADLPLPGQIVIWRSVCNAGPVDPAAEAAKRAEESRLYREGLIRWQAYFARLHGV